MKKIILFIVILAGQSFAQLNVWRWQNPLPVGDDLLAVQMFSLDNIYACGENGVFMRTTDGGQTWDVQTNILKFKESLNALSFATSKFGMCAGDSGVVLKTTDGGKSWQISQTNITWKINGVLVIDTNIAILVSDAGTILKTIDGGTNWETLAAEGYPRLRSIRMLRPDFITITGDAGTILRSHDEFVTPPTHININKNGLQVANNFYTSDFTDSLSGTILGDNGLVFHTTDGGTSWLEQTPTVDSLRITATFNGIDGKDPNILCIAGDFGTILYTTDGGKDWSQSILGTIGHIKGISFFDAQNATAVGRDGIIMRTTDAGKDWFFLPQIPQVQLLLSVAFPRGDTSLGIAVGNQGVIMRTTDGGRQWKVIPLDFKGALRSVTFSDSLTAYAVGDYGAIFKSTDGGQTWNKQISPVIFSLNSISFATPIDGLIVGDSNTVLKLQSDAGLWVKQANPGALHGGILDPIKQSILSYTHVNYPDKMHAFMSCDQNFFISGDGGISWSDSWIYRDIRALSFSDSVHGAYAWVDDCDTCIDRFNVNVLFTSDGGSTWNNNHITGDIRVTFINDIQCFDNFHATAVGNGGYIGHTTDGGVTWNEQQSNTPNNLHGVCFGTLKAGTAVGWRGNIMRITTDEEPFKSVANETAASSIRIVAYPNPSNKFVTIQYFLPSSGITRMEIFSIDGILISSLEEYKTSGEYSLNFNTIGLANGTYLCRITSNGASAQKEIIVSR